MGEMYISHPHVSGSLCSVLGDTRLEGSVVSHWHQPLTLQGFLCCIQTPSLSSCGVWPLTHGEEVISQPFTNHCRLTPLTTPGRWINAVFVESQALCSTLFHFDDYGVKKQWVSTCVGFELTATSCSHPLFISCPCHHKSHFRPSLSQLSTYTLERPSVHCKSKLSSPISLCLFDPKCEPSKLMYDGRFRQGLNE